MLSCARSRRARRGAENFNELGDYARDCGVILWDLDDGAAVRFLAM